MKLFRVAFFALVALLLLGGSDARADVGDRLHKLSELKSDVLAARGPVAYVALRKVWGEWDRGDPTEVEEVLGDLAHEPGLSAPARAYAGLLEAYARRRRGDLEGARARIEKLGYVSRWLIAGPFDNEGKGGGSFPFEPEKQLTVPLNLAVSFDGKDHRPVKWRVPPAVSPFAWLDLGAFFRPTENMCGYAVTFVRDARAKDKPPARTISLWAGSAGAMRVWWNATEVLHDEKYRDLDSDRFAAQVTLRPGYNRLLVKVCGTETPPMLSLRLADPTGAPDAHLEIDADAIHSTRQGGAVEQLGRGAEAAPAGAPLEGPAQAFERLAKSDDPTVLEAYARYLLVTQSDDPAEHRARELSRKAAEKAPTIPRLLLAGETAEDRNQRAIWIERAEALVKKGASRDDAIATLLARAGHERTGSNFRDAIPFYERVIAMDPDNVPASLAMVELYEQAGLRETSLAQLDRALARRPKSVALLRASAAALRQESRTTEADEMAERYAALRFDDPTFVKERIDLAVARRDVAGATRWIDRLVATNPDSSGALTTAANAYQSFGDNARAIANLRRSLDLAPEDTDAMRELASVYSIAGQRDEQMKLLRRILELSPQAKDIRDYVALAEPSKPRPDETYARPASEFLAHRDDDAQGKDRRTLVDLQVTTVFPNGLASRFHQVVFQPLTDAAAALAREYAFGFEADSETVQLRGARVYKKSGEVDETFESGEGSADDPNASVYTSARAFYVRFARLNPGDVVELLYRVEDVAQRNAFADYFGEVVYLQSMEPVGRAEYVLITPKSRNFYFNTPNVPGLQKSVREDQDKRIYDFFATNVAAVDPEANMPPPTEFLGHVHVSTYRTWDDVGKWYWGLVKDQFIPDEEVKQRVADLTKGLTDPRAKIKAVYDYVVQKTRYVALEFGIHGFKPYRCAQIFARGFGDCKDKATLIVTMLKELGIPATIVIVRTGNKGLFETEPASLAPFDHAIAYVPAYDWYLDGTAEYTGSGELPAMDRGAMALQINEGAPKLVHLPDPPAKDSVTAQKVEATLASDGSAQIDWKVDLAGVDAGGWRVKFHADATRKQRIQQLLANLLPGADVSSLDASNLEDVEQPVHMHVRAKAPTFARKDGATLTVPVGPHEHFLRDYAPMATRKLDARFYAQWSQEYDWTLHLPAGSRLTTTPTEADVVDPRFGRCKVEVEANGQLLHVKTTLEMDKTRLGAAEYPDFRAWCASVDRALGQRAVVTVR